MSIRSVLFGVLAASSLVLTAPASAQETFKAEVTRFVPEKLKTFDAQGNPTGEVARSALPRTPVPVVAYGVNRMVGIEYGGKVIYLKSLEVIVSRAPCTQVTATTRHSGEVVGGTEMGMGAACR